MTLTDNTELTPLENYLWDLFQNDPVLANAYGPYFEWNLDPQGLPYILVIPRTASPTLYPFLGNTTERVEIVKPICQISVFSKDRQTLIDPDTGVLAAISRLLQATANAPLKHGQVCLSSLLQSPWQTKFDQGGTATGAKKINTNIWHGSCVMQFFIEKKTGVL